MHACTTCGVIRKYPGIIDDEENQSITPSSAEMFPHHIIRIHPSVKDARTAMEIYQHVGSQRENEYTPHVHMHSHRHGHMFECMCVYLIGNKIYLLHVC